MEYPIDPKVPAPLRPLFQAFAARNAAEMAACFTPDAEVWRFRQPTPLTGPAIQAWLEVFISQFKEASVHRMRWFENCRAILCVAEITVTMDLLGLDPHLATFAVVYQLGEDGRIARLQTFIDAEGAIRMTRS